MLERARTLCYILLSITILFVISLFDEACFWLWGWSLHPDTSLNDSALFCAMSCYAMLCYVMLMYVYVMLCYDLLFCTTPCHIMSYYMVLNYITLGPALRLRARHIIIYICEHYYMHVCVYIHIHIYIYIYIYVYPEHRRVLISRTKSCVLFLRTKLSLRA